MKKLWNLTLVLATIALCGACSSEDAETDSKQTVKLPIAFESYVGRSTTRGTIVDGTSIRNEGVGVFAMYTDGAKYGAGSYTAFSPNFMNNVKVASSSSMTDDWTYAPVRFWPSDKDDYVSFLAYAPYQATAPTLYSLGTDGSFTANTGDATWMKFDVNADPAKQVDLLRLRRYLCNMQYYRDADGNVVKNSDGENAFTGNSNQQVVNMTMLHACARIAVVVTAPVLTDPQNFNSTVATGENVDEQNEGNASITVNKVVLLGDNSSATSSDITGAFTPSAYLCLTNKLGGNAKVGYTMNDQTDGFWKGQATTGKLAFTLNSSVFASGTYGTTGSSKSSGNSWTSDNSANNVLKAKQSLDSENKKVYSVNTIGTNSSNYMFVIPQDFTSDSNPLYCYIDYTVNYKDASGTLSNGVTYHTYGRIRQTMHAGGAYVINIRISNTSLNPIDFKVTPEAWANEAAE